MIPTKIEQTQPKDTELVITLDFWYQKATTYIYFK